MSEESTQEREAPERLLASVEPVLGWLKSLPGGTVFHMGDAAACLLGRYARAHGYPDALAGTSYWWPSWVTRYPVHPALARVALNAMYGGSSTRWLRTATELIAALEEANGN